MEIKISNLEHTYMPRTPFEYKALSDIDLHIPSGQFVAIIGHTGSGKSTIVQHINGLLKPTKGTVKIGEFLIEATKKNKQLGMMRKYIGMVFQYPEHQLFDETVEKDIAFGPLNFGSTKEEAFQRVREVLPLVHLNEDILQKSPFDLSGGQKRRVAIAGVLASKPKILILDEPTAGLDPLGRKQMMKLFVDIHQKEKLTTILVTHNMEFAAIYADLVVVMDKGRIVTQGTPEMVFRSAPMLHKLGLDVPDTLQLALMLENRFQTKFRKSVFTNESLLEEIDNLLEKRSE